jgi:hypothetical protein
LNGDGAIGLALSRARELVRFDREQRYRREDIVRLIEQIVPISILGAGSAPSVS